MNNGWCFYTLLTVFQISRMQERIRCKQQCREEGSRVFLDAFNLFVGQLSVHLPKGCSVQNHEKSILKQFKRIQSPLFTTIFKFIFSR